MTKRKHTIQSSDPVSRFKVKLSNLSPYLDSGSLKNQLIRKFENKELKFACKKHQKSTLAYLVFNSESDRSQAYDQLKEFTIKSQPVTIEIVSIEKNEEHLDFQNKKRLKVNDDRSLLPLEERIQDQVTPFWRQPYDKQLVIKQRKIRDIIRRYNKTILKSRQDSTNTTINEVLDYQEDVIIIENFKPSPRVNGYRNKCEFSIGLNEQGEVAIGFKLGAYKDGFVSVASPAPCLNVNEPTKSFVEYIQSFIRQSKFKPVDRAFNEGLWRLLVVRTFYDGKMMALFSLNKSFSMTLDEKRELEDNLKDYCRQFLYTETASNDLSYNIVSLMFQWSESTADAIDYNADTELLYGDDTLCEKIGEYMFEVSPLSFLQVNTDGCKVLYDTVKDLLIETSSVNKDSILLDLCCGTGTIGIYLSESVKRVIGVEIIPAAVNNAKKNSLLNGVSNTDWVCGKVEERLNAIMSKLDPNSDVIVVLDPPRAGVDTRVIKSIRASKRISRLLYISCNAISALPNFVSLSRPTSNKYEGPPFELQRVIPIDMFPHTDHYELVLFFKRPSRE